MNSTQKELLSLLGKELFNSPTDAVVTSAVLEEARSQAVSTLIAKDYQTLSANIRIISAHAEMDSVLDDIPYTTLKGYASAYYYPNPEKRTMGDVDIITSSSSRKLAARKMTMCGWKNTESVHSRHETFSKGNVKVELHSEIKGIPNGVDGIQTDNTKAENMVRSLLEDLIPSARKVETQYGQIIIPNEFHHGLIMLLHVAGHILNDGGVGLRHVCDWAVFVNRIDLSRYQRQLESIGLWTFARMITAVSTEYIGLPRQEWTGQFLKEDLEDFIEDVLRAGNFGNKENGRRATLDMERRSFSEITRERYPLANHVLLLPVFMAVNAVRYMGLILLGKRKIIKPSTFVRAKRRKDLYAKFKLFE